jgi:hypothetical protein
MGKVYFTKCVSSITCRYFERNCDLRRISFRESNGAERVVHSGDEKMDISTSPFDAHRLTLWLRKKKTSILIRRTVQTR